MNADHTRAVFLAALFNAPYGTADAIVVLCGEDCRPRLEKAAQLLSRAAAPCIVLIGGRDEPPIIMGEVRARPVLMGMGVAADRIHLEPGGPHTAAQAANLTAILTANGWTRVILVVSGYHMPRAYLTVLRALAVAGLTDTVRVLPATANQSAWWQPVEGRPALRADLLLGELAKIETYSGFGHCATYADGIAYLQKWESPL